jgi:hypothetical protein
MNTLLAGKQAAGSYAAATHTHDDRYYTETETNNLLAGKQNNLGFTPVQQGGGAGQGTNKIYIGWSGSQLQLQVDNTNFGANWPINVPGVGVPAGAVMAFAMNAVPTGWLAANGAAVSRATYATLFAAVGTTYGAGDGGTTFNLPDLRGYFVRGAGTNGDGVASGAFGAKQQDAFMGHGHGYAPFMNTLSYAIGCCGTGIPVWNANAALVGVPNRLQNGANTFDAPRFANETRPANIAMLYCIKF